MGDDDTPGGSDGPGLRIPVGAPGVGRPSTGPPGPASGPAATSDPAPVASMYQVVGGQPFFDELARRFYDRVRDDEVLLSLYPDPDDLGPAAERLSLFLAQYWGGPTTYSDRRGHPRLRMRHAPYRIDLGARDRWLDAMTAALSATLRGDTDTTTATDLDDADLVVVERQFLDYFTMAADHLVNATD